MMSRKQKLSFHRSSLNMLKKKHIARKLMTIS